MKNYWQLGSTLDLGTYPRDQEMQFSLSDRDTEQHFKNIQGTRHQGDPQWHADSFTYKYNSDGFRSCKFDINETKPKILTLGCSHTVGVGIPQYNNWPEQFGQRYFPNHTVWNVGLGGAGADTIARLAVNMIPIIQPKIVVVLWPSLFRFETYENNIIFNGAWSMERDNLQYEDNTAYNNQTKNKTILELLQKVYRFKLLSIEGRIRQAQRMKHLADGIEMAGKIAVADFVCPTEKTRQEFGADYTVWMDTISEGRFTDTNILFETPLNVDYHVKDWFNNTHAELMKVITNYIARNKSV